jgi:hypothetical protein
MKIQRGVKILALISLSLFFIRLSLAASIYGCPKDELILGEVNGTCPDGTMGVEVREGCIFGLGRYTLDTISDSDKKELGIKRGADTVVIAYKSPTTGEVKFDAGKDRNGKNMNKYLIVLKYEDRSGRLSSKPISDFGPIRPGPDEDKELEKERVSTSVKVIADLKRAVNESKKAFFEQCKNSGFSEANTVALWKEMEQKMYEEYGYDPSTNKIKNIDKYMSVSGKQ